MLTKHYNNFLKTKRLLAFSFWLLAFTNYGMAQVTISGNILDRLTQKPLPGASLRIENSFVSAASDDKGNYAIHNLKKGNVSLVISFIGYNTIRKDLTLRSDTIINFEMEYSPILGEEINIIATRAQPKTPVTYSAIDRLEIQKANLGKDLPYIVENTPSVVVTSDAGTGIGYTGINIRGSDLTRINVTLNGIPLNDAESQGVWFVDLPDLASSTDNIQIQRGVGTSTNGAGAFGASVNIQTTPLNQDPYAELNSSAGSFNTFKNTLRFGTGMMANKFAFDGRISRITSDGYIDRAFSKLTSFYISGGYFGKKTTVKLNILSGFEKTYQAWEGVPKDSLPTNRTYNPAGEYTDRSGNLAYYDNQTDNYSQTHYQLIISQEFSHKLNASAGLHYTHGTGYYENYKENQSLTSYGLDTLFLGSDTVTKTNLINRKWLDNGFYGATFSVNYNPVEKIRLTIGGAGNYYDGKHYGRVIWAEYASNGTNETNWYDNTGRKTDVNVFARMNYQVVKKLNIYADLQYRYVNYQISGTLDDLRFLDQTHIFNFFNPKAGLYFDVTDNQSAYFSFAVGNREPNRNNYEVAETAQMPVNETMYDYELGYKLRLAHFMAGANLYYMDYKNQLVLTGMINSVGEAIMTNVPHSFRSGIELSASADIFKWLQWSFNSTFSTNKIKNFTQYIDNYDNEFNWINQVERNLGTTDLSFSPDMILFNSFVFKPVKNLSLTLNSRYVGRQYIDNTSNKEHSLDPWFVTNINIGYSIKTRFIREIGFSLMVNNIFSTKYETSGWVYPYLLDGTEYEENGYFPQAIVNFLFGITVKI